MNRILIFSILLLTTMTVCYAQESSEKKQKLPSYDEYIGAVGKKTSINVVGVESDTTSDECKLSIMSELSIIRQQYRLKRNKDYYGKGGKSYFGETYTLGVKVAGGMYLSDEVIEPWKRDAEYQKRNASGDYGKERYWTYQRSLSDSVYKVKDLGVNFADDGDILPNPVNGDKSLYMLEDSRPDFGLEIDNMPGEKKGVMVWAYSRTNVQDSAMVVDLRQTSMNINAQADSTLLAVTPSEPEKIIGGVYMVPKIEGRGVVRYQLAGVAVKTKEDKWALQLLVMEDALTESKGEAPESEPKKKGSKKKRTKSAGSIELAEEPKLIK